MDPQVDSLYGGVSGVQMAVEEFELGYGVVLRRTFAHFMAPFLMAFAPPPEKGKPHPTPYSAVSGGFSYDIFLELYVPSSFERPNFFDRVNTIWWITSLIRLRGAFQASAPVIADRPFTEVPHDWQHAVIFPVEVLPRQRLDRPVEKTSLDSEDLTWLKNTWLDGGRVMNQSADFNDVYQALDASGSLPSPSVALLAVWGALEHIFSPARAELRFRVSANIASFLEPPGEQRLDLFRRLNKLYDARSQVAHGVQLKSADSWTETFSIANRVLHRILSDGHVPTKHDLEQELFDPKSS